MATFLSYLDGPMVLDLMQFSSKTTRAYIYNADALKGYLLPVPIKVMEVLDAIEDKKEV